MLYMAHNVPASIAIRVQGTKRTIHNNKTKVLKIMRCPRLRGAFQHNDRLLANLVLILLNLAAKRLENIIVACIARDNDMVILVT